MNCIFLPYLEIGLFICFRPPASARLPIKHLCCMAMSLQKSKVRPHFAVQTSIVFISFWENIIKPFLTLYQNFNGNEILELKHEISD